MRTTGHARAGVARRCFSTGDLLSERFEFEGSTLAHLRSRQDTVPHIGVASEETTDR